MSLREPWELPSLKKVPAPMDSVSGTKVSVLRVSGIRSWGRNCLWAEEFDLELPDAKVALESARARFICCRGKARGGEFFRGGGVSLPCCI